MKNNIYKNLKTWLARTLIAGSLIGVNNIRADNTNAPHLQIALANTNLTITVSPTSPTRMYSLQEKTNLYDSAWNEVATSRGTESNLVFDVNTELPQKFFKAKSNYEPVEPTNYPFSYTHGTTTGIEIFNRQMSVVNYDNTNINVIVDISVPFNPYNIDYSSNMPFTNSLVPGINLINTSVSLNCGYGSTLWGTFDISRIE